MFGFGYALDVCVAGFWILDLCLRLMEAIEELSQLADSMRQAAALLADEDVDESSSSSNSRRPSTFLNVVALGNVVSSSFFVLSRYLGRLM